MNYAGVNVAPSLQYTTTRETKRLFRVNLKAHYIYNLISTTKSFVNTQNDEEFLWRHNFNA